MRLISKIHDYYDGIVKNTVHDKTYTFVRETLSLGTIDSKVMKSILFHSKTEFITISGEIVGFCGQLFPCVRIERTPSHGYNIIDFKYYNHVVYVYNLDDIENIVSFALMEPDRKFYYSPKDIIASWLKGIEGVSSFWNRTPYDIQQDTKLKQIFQDKRVAYFRVWNQDGQTTVESYPILKKMCFFKIYDAYTCFQKLEQFLTNELVKPDLVDVKITDKLKAETHGFDKWSFRKESLKKDNIMSSKLNRHALVKLMIEGKASE